MRHLNNGDCPQCEKIFERYPGFYRPLKMWFKSFQASCPSAHISCAGRGEIEQEAAKVRGASKASFGKSAHNYNAAIDIFEMQGDSANIYERAWFIENLAPRIEDWLEWYGAPGAKFPELPHVQVKDWRKLVENGLLALVK